MIRHPLFRAVAAVGIGAATFGMSAMASAADIKVYLGEDVVVRLPDRVSTIVIGQPFIADVSMQSGGLVVITGKGYGTTNLVVLDRAGAVLADHAVLVQGPADADYVVVHKAAARRTYYCGGSKCEPTTAMLGDDDDSGVITKEHPCESPDDRAADGSRCGLRSAWSRPGGRPGSP
jgi:hypothetical protein